MPLNPLIKVLKILVFLPFFFSLLTGSIRSLPKILKNSYIKEKLYLNIHDVLTKNLNESLKVITVSVLFAVLFSIILHSLSKKKLSISILYCSTITAISATAIVTLFLNTTLLFSRDTILFMSLLFVFLTPFLYRIYSSKYSLIKNSKLTKVLTSTSIVGGVTSLFIFLTLYLFLPLFIKQTGKGKPNIILVTIDTLRADHLGCYGYKRNTSPFIDSFSKKSVLFTNAITPMPTTDPAHASIHTSLYPAKHGVLTNGWVLGERPLTLAEILFNEGYFTQGFVSVNHLGSINGFGQGFKDFNDDLGGKYSITPTEITDKAIEKLNNLKEPFYLWIHYWDPHSPYNPPKSHDIFNQPGYSQFSFFVGKFKKELTKKDFERIISLYDGEINYTDSELRRLFYALERKDALDNSLIILTADHGEIMDELAEDYSYAFDHGEYLFDGNVKVPLIIQFPKGNYEEIVIDKQVSIMDILPTVLNYLGKKWRKTDGHSLMELLKNKKTKKEFLFLQRRYKQYKRTDDFRIYPEFGIRTSEWKFILDEDTGTQQLFNLIKDPAEKINLVYSKTELTEALYKELIKWRQAVGEVVKQEISEKQKEILKSLGYIQ